MTRTHAIDRNSHALESRVELAVFKGDSIKSEIELKHNKMRLNVCPARSALGMKEEA